MLVLGLVAGCGRVAFDGTTDGGTITPSDVAVITDAPVFADCSGVGVDGLACDDGNICTAESYCGAGACVPTAPMATCTITGSETDFNQQQGVGGWYYGVWTAQNDPSYEPATDFVEALWGGSAYGTASGTYTYLAWWGAHPDATPLEYAVRRWISNVHGPALIDVRVGKSDTGCGDGVEAELRIDGVVFWTQAIAFDDGPGVSTTVPANLTLGTYVEYLLGPVGTDSCDSTETTFVVRSSQ